MANSQINATNRPAIGGSGVTVMKFGGDVVAFCNGVTVTWPSAVAEAVPVQPMDAIRPLEIVTARAIGAGTIALTLTNLYNEQIWDRFEVLQGLDDLADIFQQIQIAYNGNLTIERYVTPAIKDGQTYVEQFLGCVITNVADGQSITNASMLIDRTITLSFRRHQRGTGWYKNMPSNNHSPDVVATK
jgi:hypothetical protein